MLGQSFSRKTRKRGRGRIWELSACKADQVAWDSIFLQTTQKKVLRHNFSEYVFVAAKFPKMRSEDKRPLKRSHFLWRWLMLGVVVMHIYSPPRVTTQNFMPICHSCQAVWILQYTSARCDGFDLKHCSCVGKTHLVCVRAGIKNVHKLRHCPRGSGA